ncbi:MAG: hypothetical protein AVDCRST_MAG35-2032, partial [uncultured Quadrisphaera sp.]
GGRAVPSTGPCRPQLRSRRRPARCRDRHARRCDVRTTSTSRRRCRPCGV